MRQLRFRYEMRLDMDQDVWDHHFLIRCRPMETSRQAIRSFAFGIDPADVVCEVADGFGNHGYAGSVCAPHRSLAVWSTGTVCAFPRGEEGALQAMYRFPSPFTQPGENIRQFLEAACEEYSGAIAGREGLEYLMNRLYGRFVYAPGTTTVRTTAAEALAGGQGVCQDYAHVFISLCRLAGVPARYAAEMMLGEGATHAWAEVWLDGLWHGYDPTNNRLVDDTYIKLTHGRDFADGTIDRGQFLGFAAQNQQILVRVEE